MKRKKNSFSKENHQRTSNILIMFKYLMMSKLSGFYQLHELQTCCNAGIFRAHSKV